MDRLGHSRRQTHRRVGPDPRREERGAAADRRRAAQSLNRWSSANVPDVTDVATMLALMREFGVAADRGPGGALVLDAAGGAQRAGALRHGPPHARQHSGAGAAACAFRYGAGVAAGRLRDRRAADRPASQGAGRRSAPTSRWRPATFTPRPKAAAARRPHRAVLAVGRRDRDRADGGERWRAARREILNAARDPEVCDLALCLVAMGARIEGAGTHRILVAGRRCAAPRAPRSDHRPHRGRHLRHRRRDHRRPSRDSRRASRASRRRSARCWKAPARRSGRPIAG